MAKTNTQRQATYRKQRPLASENGERRINTWVTTNTALALERLASRYGVTKRVMLEKLIREAEDTVLITIDSESEVWENYFALRSNADKNTPK